MIPPPNDILTEAYNLTNGARQDDYAHPSVNLGRTAACWSVIFGIKVTAQQVALAQIALKMCRQIHKHTKDNLTDIAGWARCAYLVTEANYDDELGALVEADNSK